MPNLMQNYDTSILRSRSYSLTKLRLSYHLTHLGFLNNIFRFLINEFLSHLICDVSLDNHWEWYEGVIQNFVIDQKNWFVQ